MSNDTTPDLERRGLSTLARKVLALLLLVMVVTSAAWLVAGWSNLLGPPSNRDLVVITISPDTTLVYENGQARALSGTSMWSGPHSGQWLVIYALPLAVLVALALIPVCQLARGR